MKRNVTPLLGHFGGIVGICSFLEPSFAFSAPLSLFLPHCNLFSFPFRRVHARLQARGARSTKNFSVIETCLNQFVLFQDQSSKVYHGFKAGHLLRLNEQTLSFVLLFFFCALWMTVLVEKVILKKQRRKKEMECYNT